LGKIEYGFVALVTTHALDSFAFAICHGIEMIITLSLITAFAFTTSIDCVICADPVTRQATNNNYILSFLIAGWCTLVIDFITYYILLKCKMFYDELGAFLDVVKEGLQ